MRTLLATLAMLSLAGATSAAAQGVTGTWEFTWETPRGTRTQRLILTQESPTLAGTMEMTGMGGRRGGGSGAPRTRTVELSDGAVDGNTIAFTVVMGGGQRSFEMRFEGTIDGETMSGTMSGGFGGAGGSWKAKRIE